MTTLPKAVCYVIVIAIRFKLRRLCVARSVVYKDQEVIMITQVVKIGLTNNSAEMKKVR